MYRRVIFLGLGQKLVCGVLILVLSAGEIPANHIEEQPIDEVIEEIEEVVEEQQVEEVEEEISFIKPVNGGSISSYYGMRYGKLHAGIDIALSSGSTIYASEKGKVIFSGWKGSYGYLVIVEHADGYETYYAHCSRLFVSFGETVEKGQEIASVGMTGNATGPHVHFEIRLNGTSLNPYGYIY